MNAQTRFFRSLALLLGMAFSASGVCRAQLLAAPWVACAEADSGATVWFRQTYIEPSQPRWALLTVATTGQVQVRMNGRNVSPLLRFPHREAGDTAAVALTFDVSAFLRPDTNDLVVWYAPTTLQRSERQLSLCLHGEDEWGEPFARVADGSWLCRRASVQVLGDGGEAIDNAQGGGSWPCHGEGLGSADEALALWKPVVESRSALPFAPGPKPGAPVGDRVAAVLLPRSFDVEGDTVAYDFAPGFCGTVRLTLRDARRGQVISANGIRYTCSGDIDEQMIGRFSTLMSRRLIICGDATFRRSQLQSVEVMELRTDTY